MTDGTNDAFSSRCHPVLNFFYFLLVLGLTMFVQHPVFLVISFMGAVAYGIWLCGAAKILKINFLLTLPMLVIVALLNPLFNHYGKHRFVSGKQRQYCDTGSYGVRCCSGVCAVYCDPVVFLLQQSNDQRQVHLSFRTYYTGNLIAVIYGFVLRSTFCRTA